MKTIKFIGLMAVMVLTLRGWAAEPPEALNLHHLNGSVTSTAFTAFSHMKFAGDKVVLAGRNAPVSVRMEDLSRITFGPLQTLFITVRFAATGEGSGTLSAYVLENGVQGQALRSGDEVEAGDTVRFKAMPESGSKVKGWRVNGKYTEESIIEKTVVLDKDLYADGLNVEVELEKEAVEVTMITVRFAATGEGSGTLSAYVLENGVQGQALRSGDEVEAGDTVRFKAMPESSSKVKGWRVNGKYTEESVMEKTVVLDKDLYADGLNVEVELEKEAVGIDGSEEYRLKVYVRNREIGIESTAGIERAEVLDMGGRLLRKGTYSQPHYVQMQAREFRTGVYIVRVRTTESTETRKIIIR